MAKNPIPRQRTGSGGWPDRRRAVSYSKKSGKSKGCALVLLAAISATVALGYGAVALIAYIA